MRHIWVSILLLGSACTTLKVQGTIEGQEVPLEVSMFREVPGAYEDESQVQVILSSVPNACRVYAFLEAELEQGGGGWRNRAIVFQRVFPIDFWELVLTLRVASIDEASMTSSVFNGVTSDKTSLKNVGQIRSELRHYVRRPDPDPEAEGSTDWYVHYSGDGGAADFDAYDLGPQNVGQWLSGAFAAGFVRPGPEEDTPAGELGVQFDSLGCDVLPTLSQY